MPETEDLLAQAQFALDAAKEALEKELPRSAARDAYACCLAVARAIAFEVRQIVPKTHKGAQTVISEIVRNRPDLPKELPGVLEQGFEAKQRIDYGPPITIGLIEASRRVNQEERMLAAARELVRNA